MNGEDKSKYDLYSDLKNDLDKLFQDHLNQKELALKAQMKELVADKWKRLDHLEGLLTKEIDLRRAVIRMASTFLIILGVGSGVAFWQGVKQASSHTVLQEAMKNRDAIEDILEGLKKKPSSVSGEVAGILLQKGALSSELRKSVSADEEFQRKVSTSLGSNTDFTSQTLAPSLAKKIFESVPLQNSLAEALVRTWPKVDINGQLATMTASKMTTDQNFRGDVVSAVKNQLSEEKVKEDVVKAFLNDPDQRESTALLAAEKLEKDRLFSGEVTESLAKNLAQDDALTGTLSTKVAGLLQKDTTMVNAFAEKVAPLLQSSEELRMSLTSEVTSSLGDDAPFRDKLSQSLGKTLREEKEFHAMTAEVIVIAVSADEEFQRKVSTSLGSNTDFTSQTLAPSLAKKIFESVPLQNSLAEALVRTWPKVDINGQLATMTASKMTTDQNFRGDVVSAVKNQLSEEKVKEDVVKAFLNDPDQRESTALLAAEKLEKDRLFSGEVTESLAKNLAQDDALTGTLSTKVAGLLQKDTTMVNAFAEKVAPLLQSSEELRMSLTSEVTSSLGDDAPFRDKLSQSLGKTLREEKEFHAMTAEAIANIMHRTAGMYQISNEDCEVKNPFTQDCSCPQEYRAWPVARSERLSIVGFLGSPSYSDVKLCVSSQAAFE